MKKLIILLTIAASIAQMAIANEIDTLWYRTMGAGAQDVNFTPDDKYVIAWANGIELWEVQEGVKEFFIPSEATGDFNYNEEYLVFAQDSIPKLFDWQTREVVEGFEKENFKLDRIRTAKSKNEFMAKPADNDSKIYFWDIDKKTKVDSLEVEIEFEGEHGYQWKRRLLEYHYLGNSDEYFYVRYNDNNNTIKRIPKLERQSNFFYHIYNRDTKELIDSLFVFQQTPDKRNFVDKMQVMDDRNYIAWNNEGGVINFYDTKNKRFYSKLVYDESGESRVNGIDFDRDNEIIAIADGLKFSILNVVSNETLQEYYYGVEHVKFSNNLDVFSLAGNSSISLRRKQWVKTHTNSVKDKEMNLEINPNPAISYITIGFEYKLGNSFKLSLIDILGSELEIFDEGISNSNNYSEDFDVSHLPSGSYFIKLEYEGLSVSKQFLKE